MTPFPDNDALDELFGDKEVNNCYYTFEEEEKEKREKEKLLYNIQGNVSPFQEILWALTFGYYNPWK